MIKVINGTCEKIAVKVVILNDDLIIDQKLIDTVGDFKSIVEKEAKATGVCLIKTYHKLDSDLVFVCLNKLDNLSIIRKKFALLAKLFIKEKITNAKIDFDNIAPNLKETLIYNAIIGLECGGYNFKKINSKLEEINVYVTIVEKSLIEVFRNAKIVAKGVNNARNLGNTPSNLLTPEILANYATDIAKEANLEIEVFDNEILKNMNAGGILAVNKGSANGARLIVLKHQAKTQNKPLIALIGKGITFDSGGYNLKPAQSMTGMKFDMCGGANVISAMEIIGKLDLDCNVIGVIPTTENMISGEGYKCDDVITMLSGKTVEITNTDAEGRLILADAITYAQKQGAKHLVDIATLTGACVNALGSEFTGGFTNDQEYFNILMDASKKEAEAIWQMPLTKNFIEPLKKSMVAQMVNSVKVPGGASIAAGFLHEFVEENTKWIHLDIAGTADISKEHDLGPAGATGVMVQTMVEFVKML